MFNDKSRCSTLSAFRFTTRAMSMAILLLMTACRQEMYDQPKYKPLRGSQFFEDGRSARPLVEGTVARDNLRIDEHLYAGKHDTTYYDTFPFPINKEIIKRGQERFNIYCSPCHDRAGTGK